MKTLADHWSRVQATVLDAGPSVSPNPDAAMENCFYIGALAALELLRSARALPPGAERSAAMQAIADEAQAFSRGVQDRRE